MGTIKLFSGFATTNDIWSGLPLKSDFDCAIAWSMGCFDAVRQYFEDPEKIKKLVLVSGTPKFIADDTFLQGTSMALFRNLEKKIVRDLGAGIRYFYDLIGDFPVFGRMPQFEKDEILKSLERLKIEDIRKLLPKIDIPVLLIHGDQDQICPVEASKHMAEVIPRSRLVVFNGAGHAPFLEEPEKFRKIVMEFLAP